MAASNHASTMCWGIGFFAIIPNINRRLRSQPMRSWRIASDTVTVLRLASQASLPGNPGGKFPNASDGQITMPATRLSRPRSVRKSAPPQSVTTRVTSVRSRASRKSATMPTMPGSVRSASSRMGTRCPPIGSTGSR